MQDHTRSLQVFLLGMAVADALDLTGEELEDMVEAVKINQLSQTYESDHESEGN